MFELILLAIGNALLFGLFLIAYTFLPPEIPLYYSHEWGEMQLGSKWEMLLIPVVMTLFYISINVFKRKAISDENFTLANLMSFINIVQISFLCFVYLRILFVVIW